MSLIANHSIHTREPYYYKYIKYGSLVPYEF